MKYHRLKYRLCMQHSYNNRVENKHNHLIEIEVIARQQDEKFIEFGNMERILKEVLDPYQYQYLNDFPEFGGNTNMENLGEVFYVRIKAALEKSGWFFSRLGISETPLRTYTIYEEEMQP